MKAYDDEPGRQDGEAVVLCGAKPHKLRYSRLVPGSVRVRASGSPPRPAGGIGTSGAESSEDGAAVYYEENVDYRIDYSNGRMTRTETSRIPDWREHPFYGRERIDHRGMTFEQYANKGYTVYVDYAFAQEAQPAQGGEAPARSREGDPLAGAPSAPFERVIRKLAAGETVVYTVFGDSISLGHDASREAFGYAGRFVRFLRQAYPQARIEPRMKARGGETSGRALARLEADVLSETPDLISIGYGMNDQNRRDDGGNSVPPEQFERNVRAMLERITAETDADVLLVIPCPPNPKWMFSSDNGERYAEALRRLGAEYRCGAADVRRVWLAELQAGKTHESLLMNNLNHPNDYGHLLYFRALRQAWDGMSAR